MFSFPTSWYLHSLNFEQFLWTHITFFALPPTARLRVSAPHHEAITAFKKKYPTLDEKERAEISDLLESAIGNASVHGVSTEAVLDTEIGEDSEHFDGGEAQPEAEKRPPGFYSRKGFLLRQQQQQQQQQQEEHQESPVDALSRGPYGRSRSPSSPSSGSSAWDRIRDSGGGSPNHRAKQDPFLLEENGEESKSDSPLQGKASQSWEDIRSGSQQKPTDTVSWEDIRAGRRPVQQNFEPKSPTNSSDSEVPPPRFDASSSPRSSSNRPIRRNKWGDEVFDE